MCSHVHSNLFRQLHAQFGYISVQIIPLITNYSFQSQIQFLICRVKNFAASTNPFFFLSFERSMFVSSTSVRDSFFQLWVRSSIPRPKLYPKPHKENPLALIVMLLLQGANASTHRREENYATGRTEGEPLLAQLRISPTSVGRRMHAHFMDVMFLDQAFYFIQLYLLCVCFFRIKA